MSQASQEMYFPGLEGVIAGETAVSTIAGGLQYRGYSISELAQKATFEEVAHLLIHGELPHPTQLDDFKGRLTAKRSLPEAVIAALRGLPAETQPMDALRSGVSLLAHRDPDVGQSSHEANLRKAERLTAQIPMLVGAHHRLRNGQDPLPPHPDLDHASHVLYQITGEEPDEESSRAMEVSLILYAEHEFNASTFCCRVTVSTLSDLHSGITSAIGTLKGPLHGGANEAVMRDLEQLDSPDSAEQWVRAKLANKEKVMGFGHRVYKQRDPRAEILRDYCQRLAQQTGGTQFEETAQRIEQIIFEEKKLPTNLDWPSARLYYYLGLPIDLYTPLFVVARITGWSAHGIEQLDHNRLIRPQARYIGSENRSFVPLEQR